MELYSSNFCTIEFEPSTLILKQVWSSGTANMTNDDFVSEQTKLASFFESSKPKKIHSDAREAAFVIAPDLQEWNAKEILSVFAKNGGVKCAILIPPDIFAQVSIQQSLEEAAGDFITRYFEDEKELVAWLNG